MICLGQGCHHAVSVPFDRQGLPETGWTSRLIEAMPDWTMYWVQGNRRGNV